MKCEKCGNEMRPIKAKAYMGMGRFKLKPTGEYSCSYCIWKGDAGPGKQLKDIIKKGSPKMVLINKAGKPVKKGDVLFDTWDEPMAVTGWREPHKPSSTGRIFLQDVDSDPADHFSNREYFPSVVGCKFIEETDNG